MIVVTPVASSRTLVRDAEAESSEPKVPAIASLAARLLTVLLMFFSATFQSPAGAFIGSTPQHHLPEYPGVGTKAALARQSIWQTHEEATRGRGNSNRRRDRGRRGRSELCRKDR
jgi:hypothetical protein